MLQSLFVYVIMIVSILGCAWLYTQVVSGTKVYVYHPCIFTIVIIYTFFCSVRYDVGVDYPAYLSMFKVSEYATTSQDISHTEPGWAYLTWLISSSHIHFAVYFGIIAYIQILLVISAFKKKAKILPIVILIFFLSGQFISFQNIIRQNIVAACFLYIAMQRYNIKFVFYVLFVLIACLIHKSALILLILYPFIKINRFYINAQWIYALIIVVCAIIGSRFNLLDVVFKNPIMVFILESNDYAYYLQDDNMNMGMGQSIGLGFMLRTVIDVIMVLNKSYVNRLSADKRYNIYFRLYFLGTSLSYLFPTSMLVNRPLMYMVIFILPIYSYYFYYVLNSKLTLTSLRKSCAVFCLVGLILLFVNSTFIDPEGNMCEYHFFWEKAAI